MAPAVGSALVRVNSQKKVADWAMTTLRLHDSMTSRRTGAAANDLCLTRQLQIS